MPKKLLDSSSSSSSEDENEEGLKINESFAKAFNNYREKEEFQKLKNKYGEEFAKSKLNQDDDDDDSSSSEEEDESAEKWTKDHEMDFLKTLSSLKKKDEKIYDQSTSFFKKSFEDNNKSKKKEKPMTLVDLERKVVTENEGQFEDLADEKLANKLNDKTYVQELNEIQSSLKKAARSSDEEESEDESDLLTRKVKSESEQKKDEEDYKKWLLGQKEHLKDEHEEGELQTLKEYWTDQNLDEGEKFLRDYILNKRYLDQSEDEEDAQDDEDLSDDEKTLEKQEEFEHKFNFRFEDPDKDFIKRYPRTIQDSMRRKDDSRKQKRQEVKERKLKEKEKKREDLMQLKAMKRKEILDKIEKLRKITGNDELAFKDEDLEDDFDPDKYDQRMDEIFQQFDDAPIQPEDEEKPVFSDLDSDLEVENWDEYGDPENEEEGEHQDENLHEEDETEDINEKESMQQELIENSKGRKKSKKKKSKFAEALESDKPVFDPNDKKFEEYLDEYYKLDYEDIIGDLPCRFKYRKVAANDLGLSTEEILSAPDRELNAWASLKKTCQYRSEEEEKRDITEYSKKKNNINLKKKILPSLFNEEIEESLQAEKEKKASKSKKRRMRAKRQMQDGQKSEAVKRKAEEAETEAAGPSKKRRKKKNKNVEKPKKVDVNTEFAISDQRLEQYGLNPSKFKRKIRKQKYKNKNQ